MTIRRFAFAGLIGLACAGVPAVSCTPKEDPDIAVASVSLDKTELTLDEGQSSTLTATVKPADATNKAVEWSSDKPEIATVDASGIVTAIKAGTAEITVTTKDGGHYDKCVVSVSKRRNLKFRVSINGGEFADAMSSYTYTLLPPGAYSGVQRFLFYVCEDDNPASVHDSDISHYNVTLLSENPAETVTVALAGQEAYGGSPKYYTPWVYPKKAGSATVKVSYDDGAGSAISREIQFTVMATAANSISLGCKEFALGANNTRKMTATFTPVDASFQDVTWSSTNTSVARVSTSGVVTAVSPGQAQIKATSTEGIVGSAKIIVWPQPNAVDLGLSVLWADINLGAESSSPAAFPSYCFFAWSETAPEKLEGKQTHSSNMTYWDDVKKYTKYCVLSSDGVVDNKTRLDLMDDAANVILGNGWRMPTAAEMQELLKLSVTRNEAYYAPLSKTVYSLRYKASNGKYIDLPLWAANLSNTSVFGLNGFYWTSSLTGGSGQKADWARYLYLDISGDAGNLDSAERTSGFCIRPVKNK